MNSNFSKKRAAVWRLVNAIRMLSQRFYVIYAKKYIFFGYFGKVRKRKMRTPWRVAESVMERATLDDVRFIFDHAEKQLREVNGISSTIVARTTTLATVTAGGLIALIGYAISRWDKTNCIDRLLFSAIIGSGYLLLQSIFLCKNLQGMSYIEIGAEPQALFLESFYKGSVTDADRLIHFYINEIESYQLRITENKRTNKKRWKYFHLSLWLLTSTPVMIAGAYLLANYFSWFLC